MDQSALRSVAPFLIGGLFLFILGAWWVLGLLPAWSLGDLQEREVLENRFGQLAQQAGMVLASDDPALSLVSRDQIQDSQACAPVYEPGRGDTPVLVRISQGASRRKLGDAELTLGLSPIGEPLSAAWVPRSLSGLVRQNRLSRSILESSIGEAGEEEEAVVTGDRVEGAVDAERGEPQEEADPGAVSAAGPDGDAPDGDEPETGDTETAAAPTAPISEPEPEEILASLLVPDGRQLEDEGMTSRLFFTSVTVFYPLTGSPPAHVEVSDPPIGALRAFYRDGEADPSIEPYDLTRRLLSGVVRVLLFLGVTGLFFAFLGRRRIDLVNGTFLATGTFLLLIPAILFEQRAALWGLESFVAALVPSLWVLVLWSTGESWLRAQQPGFSTSLDALRLGRLGPRGGRALLAGLGLGAGLAGLRLAFLGATELTDQVGRTGLSVSLPIYQVARNPVADGILLASSVLLAAVICQRCLPRRWALWVAAPVVALALGPVPLAPTVAAVGAGAAVIGGLLFVFHRFELTGLLAACVALYALPAIGVSVQLLDWMPGSFALTTGLLLALGSLGVVGLGREEEQEARGMGAPAFVRRLEDEKRLHHEMGLLARMQLGLLPETLPRMDGWEISARSVLATEVGGDLYDFLWDDEGKLWVAAGDVSGHGYSCAIVHAMTKAALASLIAPERTPGEVLGEVDRVLRSVRYRRAFTSLVLLQLDPVSGEGLLANAGHPYPMLFSEGRVHDVELPGLPLGQGPPRSYGDKAIRLEVGAVLALCSDGLFEATDREVRAYGFDRPRQLLVKAARWPSNEVLEMLLADWRRHRGPVAATDDTTVLVIKRLAAEERAMRTMGRAGAQGAPRG